MFSRTRTDVQDEVSGFHHVPVVLHHHDRIPEVPQFGQRTDQPLVVPLVQPNARLVKDVEHIGELRTDLRGQSDALRLSAGKGLGRTVKAQVIQSHIEHKARSGLEFLENLRCDHRLFSG